MRRVLLFVKAFIPPKPDKKCAAIHKSCGDFAPERPEELKGYRTQHLPAVLVSAVTRRLTRKCAAKGIDLTNIINYEEQNDPLNRSPKQQTTNNNTEIIR